MKSLLIISLALANAAADFQSSGIGGANMNGDYVVQHGTEQVRMQGYSERDPTVEWFDVYSPEIKTLYAQVYWTMMDGVPLPPKIVKRFRNKTMAVVGYECNQLGRTDDGREYAIPINAAYNHHHGSYLKSTNAVLKRVPAPDASTFHHADSDGMVWVAEDTRPLQDRTGPASTTFHEGNGGEFRKVLGGSYHGYSNGHAQLVESPASFHLQPMQIDTWNRTNVNASTGGPGRVFVPGIQPRNSFQLAPDALYSGLLECPCTDRIAKRIDGTTAPRATGKCPHDGFQTLSQCHAGAVAALSNWRCGPNLVNISAKAVNDPSLPPGCSVHVDLPTTPGREGRQPPQGAYVVFNSATQGVSCGGASGDGDAGSFLLWGAALRTASNPVGMYVSVNNTHLEITASGPSDVWFGIGINASMMSDTPWTLVVDGYGNVSERRLGNHAPGDLLPSKLTVLSATQSKGRRSVVVSRPLPTELDVGALRATMQLPVITAVGGGKTFAYHRQKAVASVTMFALGAPTCLCEEKSTVPFGQGKGHLIYTPVADEPGGSNSSVPGAPATSLGFWKSCLAYPFGTMLLEKNPTCDLRAYTGGQSCCHHMFTLLDKDQKTPDQDKFLVYRMKWRFWFHEVTPEKTFTDVTQFNWGGMASPTEYDVPKCGEGVFGCTKGSDGHWTHTMNGTWTVGQMRPRASRTGEPEPKNATAVKFLSIHGHCHAPTCIQFDLYNADTNELICRQKPLYGDGSGENFQEEGYVNIPPCVFGSAAEGLPPPPGGERGLSFGTRLFSKKICRADYGHHGEMSLWQTYGVLVV